MTVSGRALSVDRVRSTISPPRRRRFVILDRDGTVNVERHYLSDPKQVELVPGALPGLVRMAAAGLGLVVVTNQSGLARGFFSLDRLREIHDHLDAILAQGGARLDGIFFCPHHPEEVRH